MSEEASRRSHESDRMEEEQLRLRWDMTENVKFTCKINLTGTFSTQGGERRPGEAAPHQV